MYSASIYVSVSNPNRIRHYLIFMSRRHFTELERCIYVHRGLPAKNRDTVASRRLQFACQNGLTVGGPNFAGQNGTEALIDFAFSDCGDAVAVVRQSQRVYTTYIEVGSQRHKLQATSCSSRRNSICVKTWDA